MCGIAGIFRRQGPVESDPYLIRNMTNLLAHRGPDDSGHLLLDTASGSFDLGRIEHWVRPCDLCLGNRRLAIIDLSSCGRQPMMNESEDCFLVFNGEIYNHEDLRRLLLSRGHLFSSGADSEVALHAYEEWGDACVSRFNGMWAFALWDQRNRRLFCSRDRFGIKPFYYLVDRETFAFASEAKALLQLLQGRPKVNERLIHAFLSGVGMEHPERTFFDGILKLKPAHNLVVTSENEKFHRYWGLHEPNGSAGHSDPYGRFRELLQDAVNLRVRNSDVPVGLALSGGLDSSSILSCIAWLRSGQEIEAFTSVFPGFRYDESYFARIAAKRFKSKLHEVMYDPSHLLNDLRQVLWHLDFPSIEYQILPRWTLMQTAATRVKVILQGQGADELLAGYTNNYLASYLAAEADFPGGWPRVLRTLLSTVQNRPLCFSMLMRCLSRLALPRSVYAKMRSPQLLNEAFKRSHPVEPPLIVHKQFGDPLTDRLHFDLTTGTLPMLLRMDDAICMAHGLESRLPFLDYRLVEYLFTLPFRLKMDAGVSKPLLRHAFKDEIPEPILERRDKIGFYAPLGKWLRPLLFDIRSILLDRSCLGRGLLARKGLEDLIEKVRVGRPWAAHGLFKILSLELWFGLFVDTFPKRHI